MRRFASIGIAVVLAVVAGGLSPWLGAEQSLDTIIIDAGYDKQTKIAIVPFQQGPELSHLQPLSDIVGFDLARSGQFAPADDENMLSYPTSRDEVFFRDWRILGVEYLVIGRTSIDSSVVIFSLLMRLPVTSRS